MSIVNADAYMYSRMLMNGDDITHGQEWKKHKYIRKEQTKAGKTRYIYPSKNNKDADPSIKDPNTGSDVKNTTRSTANKKPISIGYYDRQYNKPKKLKKAANLFNIAVQIAVPRIAEKKVGELINKTIKELDRKKLKDHANLANIGNAFIDAAKRKKESNKYPGPSLSHSAKGSTWKEHKYIKRVNGTYYYPASYKGGRHLEEGGGTDEENEEYDQAAGALSSEDIEALAKEVIRGNFGNGQERKDLLGDNYRAIQDRVNEILLGKPTGSSSSNESRELYTVPQKTVDKGKEAINKSISSNKNLAESLISIGKSISNIAPNERGKRQSEKRK